MCHLLQTVVSQFVILNLFTSFVPRDKVRLFNFKYLIQQLRLEWIISLKDKLFGSSL